MRKIGMMLAALALVAMTPSYGKKADAAARSTKVDESTSFNGLKTCIKFVDNTKPAGGNGTFLHPYNDIATAVNSSNDKCVIYIKATGTPYTLASTVTLKKEQSLIGSSVSFNVEGREIAPLTKSAPVVEVSVIGSYYDFEPGIEVGTSNRIIGLSFHGVTGEETAIGSAPDGVAKTCVIDKNQFNHLQQGVLFAQIQPKAKLEFDGNRFSDVATNIGLYQADGVETRICNNHFTNIGVDDTQGAAIFSFPNTMVSESAQNKMRSYRSLDITGQRARLQEELLAAKENLRANFQAEDPVFFGNLFIAKNTFENSPSSSFGIFCFLANRLDLFENKFFNIGQAVVGIGPKESTLVGNSCDKIALASTVVAQEKITAKGNKFIGPGLAAGIAAPAGSAHFEKNTFSGLSTHPVGLTCIGEEGLKASFERNTFSNYVHSGAIVILLEGAIACIEENSFSDNLQGLTIALDNGAAASVEKNQFSHNGLGFVALGAAADYVIEPKCLELIGNCAKDSATIDFAIENLGETSLFELKLCNNEGSLDIVGNDVTLVKQCPRCAKPR